MRTGRRYNGKLTSPSQVDNHLLEFHRVSGCAVWYRVLNALADADYFNHFIDGVMYLFHLGPIEQCSIQGFAGRGPSGRDWFPGSAPRQIYIAPRRLQPRRTF